MTFPRRHSRRDPLWGQLLWFIRLRWIAAGGVILAGLADRYWLGWYTAPMRLFWVGVGILAYNILLRLAMRTRDGGARRRSRRMAMVMAWVQIAADLGCLTLLTLWTGGIDSPLLGFPVFHMVIASLLLPQIMAYAGAVLAGVMLVGALTLMGQLPEGRQATMTLLGWFVTILTTVYLASNVTRRLRRHQRRVLKQSVRIMAMSRRLRRQRQLMIQHEKMAAMGQMAAGVAHEIANPLASMDSLLQLIQRKPDRMDGEAARKLRDQIDRINRTVRQLTNFAHPGESTLERASVDHVVGRAMQLVRFDRRIRRAKLEISREIPEGAGWINVRPHAIEQVLVNILLNALDAMADRPGPRLRIRTMRRDGQCCVEVSDNGHGIAPGDIGHVFDPFFTTKPVGKGTGLGLAISYSAVRDHGGTIEVDSNEDGTKFTISLPPAD